MVAPDGAGFDVAIVNGVLLHTVEDVVIHGRCSENGTKEDLQEEGRGCGVGVVARMGADTAASRDPEEGNEQNPEEGNEQMRKR